MLAQHRDAFFEVATEHKCWIGLRDPNPLADRWIGKPGCYPKPVTCKAKTADVPGKPFSGLVVCPFVLADHFTHRRLERARAVWEEFESLVWETAEPDPAFKGPELLHRSTLASPSRFAARSLLLCGADSTKYDYHLIVDGPRRGVVLYRGSQVFADYDLFAVVGADAAGQMTAQWSAKRHTERYRAVMQSLNAKFQFSICMVQHGADFDWQLGTATAEGDAILWFGPSRNETHNPLTDGQFSVTRIESAPNDANTAGNSWLN